MSNKLKFAHLMHFGAVFNNPIVACNAAIKIPVLDVAADFLRANETDHQRIVIDIRRIGTAADLDVEARLGHFGNGGVLKTALGQP